MWWFELLTFLAFLPAMAGYPCCCHYDGPPWEPPHGGPYPSPDTGCDCADCLGHGCSQCVMVSFTFASEDDPLDCPCDLTIPAIKLCHCTLSVCTKAWGNCEDLSLPTSDACENQDWCVSVGISGETLYVTVGGFHDTGQTGGTMTTTATNNDCYDITYNVSGDVVLDPPWVGVGPKNCRWTGATVVFGACT